LSRHAVDTRAVFRSKLGGKPDELSSNEAIRAAYLGGHAKASA
jgi:branched-chain amino acid transport system ATP-binding protein